MAYDGVKYKTTIDNNKIPIDPRIDELRHWCTVFHEKELAPTYPGGTHGNMSFRLEKGKPGIVITAARSSFAEFMTDDSFFTIHDINFEKLVVHVSGAANREPSSETLLHFAIYQKRPDVQAILHGHCKAITSYAEQMEIPVTRSCRESGTMEIVDNAMEILGNHSFIEIKDHGFLAMAGSIQEAGELAMKMLKRSAKFSASF